MPILQGISPGWSILKIYKIAIPVRIQDTIHNYVQDLKLIHDTKRVYKYIFVILVYTSIYVYFIYFWGVFLLYLLFMLRTTPRRKIRDECSFIEYSTKNIPRPTTWAVYKIYRIAKIFVLPTNRCLWNFSSHRFRH